MTEYKLGSDLGSVTVRLASPNDPELDCALAANGPLPDRDVEVTAQALAPLAVPGLPVGFSAGGAVGVGSYRRIEDALAKAGFTFAIPDLAPGGAACRFTILYGRLDGAGKASVAAPVAPGITAQVKAGATGGLRFAILAAVPKALGAVEHFRPVLENLTVPPLIRSCAALAPNVAILSEANGKLSLSAGVKFGYDLTWLREASAGRIEGDIGVRVNPCATAALDFGLSGGFTQCITREPDGWIRLRVAKLTKRTQSAGLSVEVGAQATTPLPGSAAPLLDAIQAGAGAIATAALGTLPDAIYRRALTALEKKYSADLSYRLQAEESDEALLDASFDLDRGGLDGWMAALDGNLSPAIQAPSSCVRFRQALLTHRIARQSRLELHLPFLNAQEWEKRLEAFGRAEVSEDAAGRLMVFTVKAEDRAARSNSYQSALLLTGALRRGAEFSLGYSDTRKTSARAVRPVLDAYGFGPAAMKWLEELPGQAPLEASLALSVPGIAASAWLDAPVSGEPEFQNAFGRVSRAVQASMRRWLPFVYFAAPERYEDLRAAWPLLVYQASLPFSGRAFTCDAQDREAVAGAIRSAGAVLPALLGSVQQLLADAGRRKTADFYEPSQAGSILGSVAQDPRQFQSLLLADALFVDRLVALGAKARTARQNEGADAAGLTRFAASLVSAFHDKLRRLYGGQDFVPFGSLILVEATAALAARADDVAMPGIVRISGAGAVRTFVNAAYRPGAVELEAEPSGVAAAVRPAAHAAEPAKPVVVPPPGPLPVGLDSADAVFRETLELCSGLSVDPASYCRSALVLYNQLSRCRTLKKTLDEQTAILTALIR